MIPGDKQLPMVTSGIRIGTPAITTRGLVEEDMLQIARLINDTIVSRNNDTAINSIKEEVEWMMEGRVLFNSEI